MYHNIDRKRYQGQPQGLPLYIIHQAISYILHHAATIKVMTMLLSIGVNKGLKPLVIDNRILINFVIIILL